MGEALLRSEKEPEAVAVVVEEELAHGENVLRTVRVRDASGEREAAPGVGVAAAVGGAEDEGSGVPVPATPFKGLAVRSAVAVPAGAEAVAVCSAAVDVGTPLAEGATPPLVPVGSSGVAERAALKVGAGEAEEEEESAGVDEVRGERDGESQEEGRVLRLGEREAAAQGDGEALRRGEAEAEGGDVLLGGPALAVAGSREAEASVEGVPGGASEGEGAVLREAPLLAVSALAVAAKVDATLCVAASGVADALPLTEGVAVGCSGVGDGKGVAVSEDCSEGVTPPIWEVEAPPPGLCVGPLESIEEGEVEGDTARGGEGDAEAEAVED